MISISIKSNIYTLILINDFLRFKSDFTPNESFAKMLINNKLSTKISIKKTFDS